LVPSRVADALSELLDPTNPRRLAMIDDLRRVRESLGEAGAAARVARMITALADRSAAAPTLSVERST
jgi:hypothetical protein